MRSNISWQESNIPRPMGKSRNGIIPTRKIEDQFDNSDKFLDWYNSTRFHESLDEKHYLQTPEDAFWKRMPDECKLNQFLLRMEKNFNDTR